MRVVLWDENHIMMIEQGILFPEVVVEINNATIRNGEIHLDVQGVHDASCIELTRKLLRQVRVRSTIIGTLNQTNFCF